MKTWMQMFHSASRMFFLFHFMFCIERCKMIFFYALFYYSGYAIAFLFIEGFKITSNLFLAILSRFPPFFFPDFHNVQKSENIQIYAFCKFC